MKYTKGEWKVEDSTQVVSGRRLVANTGGWSTNYEPSREENETNAHLIAAAPDMYEALKALGKAIFIITANLQPCEMKDTLMKLNLDGAKALAKAEGK